MEINENANQKLIKLISINRLNSYKFRDTDDGLIIFERYLYNIEVSKALYPLLSLLEISLRNSINNAIDNTIKRNWLIEELEQQDILKDKEYKILKETETKLVRSRKTITAGNLIAELSLGFWVHLCTKKYKIKLWHKKNFFRQVFNDYPNFIDFDKLTKIYPLLRLTLVIRNRIFHHEIIINNSAGIENCYDNIKTLLSYISKDCLFFLDEVCEFKKVIKQKP